ncbi:MAG: hypothetical protein AAF756_17950 [Pseudomonadota bacterium]
MGQRAEIDGGQRPGRTSAENEDLKELQCENLELKRANEILRKASALCAVLPIVPSTFYEHKARERGPSRYPTRHHRDEALKPEIQLVWSEQFQVYGVRKVWK